MQRMKAVWAINFIAYMHVPMSVRFKGPGGGGGWGLEPNEHGLFQKKSVSKKKREL